MDYILKNWSGREEFSKIVRLLKYRYYILNLILPEFSPPYPIAKGRNHVTPASINDIGVALTGPCMVFQ
jgi:hypothetical protein